MGKKSKKAKREDTKLQDVSKSSSVNSGTGKRKKHKEKNLIDLEVEDLVLNIGENDNTDITRKERFRQVALVQYLQKNVENMYPNIGRETYRVPDVYINKGKEAETNEEDVFEQIKPEDTYVRSDRAHSFVTDMVHHLSVQMKDTSVGPFFIIVSYEYDHYLSRLRSFFNRQLNISETGVNFPHETGHERGEMDIFIVLPKHVIFVEVKAIGDNFHEFPGDKISAVNKNMKKTTNQLIRNERVFDYIMKDLKLQDFKRTKIAALPNLKKEL